MAEAQTMMVDALEPYRGRRGALSSELGADGLRWLYVHPEVNGSPTAACEFLGFATASRKNITTQWAMLGLSVNRRDAARAPVVKHGFRDGLTTDDWREHYLGATGRIECAPVFDWKLPEGTEYGILACVSDLHYGAAEMDYRSWLQLRDWIGENSSRRFVLLGDLLNVATKHGVSDPDELPMDVAQALLTEDLRPIAQQCFMALAGNHEGRIMRETGLKVCPVESVCKDLGIYYAGRDGFLRLRVSAGERQQAYDGYLHHGFGGAQTPGGKVNYLFRKIANLDVDFLAMGHVHDRFVAESVRQKLSDEGFTADGGGEYANVETVTRPMVFCGSYLKYERGSYARAKGLPPTATGSVSLHFYTDRHSVHGRK